MLELGTIQPSQSAWCNVVVLVRKKDGGLHFCIHTSAISTPTWRKTPIPCQESGGHERVLGAGHFSCLDLKLGFGQIKMEEASKQYTTYMVGNLGFFEWNSLPFGLCNVQATFQWLMQNCLGKLNLIYCLIYLDDIVVFSQMAEEHLHWLQVVLDWFTEYNMKLTPSNIVFSKRRSPTWCIGLPRKVFNLAIQTCR